MNRPSPTPTVSLSHQPSEISITASDKTIQTFYTAAPTPTPRPPLFTFAQASIPPPNMNNILKQTEPASAPVPPSQPSRQDSGYESIAHESISSRRRISGESHSQKFYISDSMATSANGLQVRRSLRSRAGIMLVTQHTTRASGSSLYLEQIHTHSQTRFAPTQLSQSTAFPLSAGHGLVHPHTSSDAVVPLIPHLDQQQPQIRHSVEKLDMPPLFPPQTQHYWTSDNTRRMEYAAIDAASHGFKGWCLRHIVPDCIIPHEQRRLGFDDDGGSVRRYRIQLEDEEKHQEYSAKKDHQQRFRLWLRKRFFS